MSDPIGIPSRDSVEAKPAMEAGLRKLVRPRLADEALRARQQARRQPASLLTYQESRVAASGQHGSHAEFFYFQKQMQAQTLMVFILDDGERIEGVIEWCDLHVIKVRHTMRTMIYKSSIKYLYKASDAGAHGLTPGFGS